MSKFDSIDYSVSKTQAASIAKEFFNDKKTIKGIKAEQINDKTVLYSVNFDTGWALVSADTRTNKILAYNESGQFDSDHLPNSGIQTWYNMITSELNYLHNVSETQDNQVSGQRLVARNWWIRYTVSENLVDQYVDDSGHLMSTVWGQYEPWNDKCPSIPNTNTHYPTGCVATAMSQILYFLHGSINKPTGLYHTVGFLNTNPIGNNSSFGFFRTDYVDPSSRWNEMALDKYDTHADYVADLMIDVGDRVNMDYTSYANYGSGGIPSTSAFFNYGIQCNSHTFDSYGAYQTRVMLHRGQPVMMMATQSADGQGGHAWVIDGYRENVYVYETEYIWHLVYTDDPGLDVIFYSEEEMAQIDPNMYDGKTETTFVRAFNNDYYRMNWGFDDPESLSYNEALYTLNLNESLGVGEIEFPYNKWIIYNFE